MLEKTYVTCGGADKDLENFELMELFSDALDKALSDANESGKVVILPPDLGTYNLLSTYNGLLPCLNMAHMLSHSYQGLHNYSLCIQRGH